MVKKQLQILWTEVAVLALLLGPFAPVHVLAAAADPDIRFTEPLQLRAGQTLQDLVPAFSAYAAADAEARPLTGRFAWQGGPPNGDTPLAPGVYDGLVLRFFPDDTVGFAEVDLWVDGVQVADLSTGAQTNKIVGYWPDYTASGTFYGNQAVVMQPQVMALPIPEKKKITSATTKKLSSYLADTPSPAIPLALTPCEPSAFSSSRRIPGDGKVYGTEVLGSATLGMAVTQLAPSKGIELEFSLASTESLNGLPVTVELPMPTALSRSARYILRDPAGNHVGVTVEGDNLVFSPTVLGGAFRLSYESTASDDEDELDAFWLDVIEEIELAGRDDLVRVSLGSRSTIPAEVLKALRGQRVSLFLRNRAGDSVYIYGMDVESIPSTRDVYKLSTLINMYGERESTSSRSSSAVPSSSTVSSWPEDMEFVLKTPDYQMPAPAASPAPAAPPVPVVPPAETSSKASAASASGMEPDSKPDKEQVPSFESSMFAEEQGEEDVELVAQEDVEGYAFSKTKYVLFMVALICTGMVAASLITVLLLSGRKKTEK